MVIMAFGRLGKKARQAKRAERIEKRKGLAKGEGKKIMANRKQRLKELWQAPPKGQEGFTKKYKGKTTGEAAGSKFAGMAMGAMGADKTVPMGDQEAQNKEYSENLMAKGIENKMDPPSWTKMFAKGGGLNTTSPMQKDRSNMTDNADSMRYKSKGRGGWSSGDRTMF